MQFLAFGTPRKLPKPSQLSGRVAVLDIAFAGISPSGGFSKITLPFVDGLGARLRIWVDHHDHERHADFAADPRFVLSTKAEHGACPEMIDPELVQRVGSIDTIVAHTDFDGLASAAKWIRGGVQPYDGCDDDARKIDTRLGQPSEVARRIDRAIRAQPKDTALFGIIVRHLAGGLSDSSLWEPIRAAEKALIPIERETRRAAQQFRSVAPGIAVVNVSSGFRKLDKTLLHLLGQEREPVSVIVDRENIGIAARFDSGRDFLQTFGLSGGMPTRVSLSRSEGPRVLAALGIAPELALELLQDVD